MQQELFLLRNKIHENQQSTENNKESTPEARPEKPTQAASKKVTVDEPARATETSDLSKGRRSGSKPFVLHFGDTSGLIDKDVFESKTNARIKSQKITRTDRGKSSSLLPEMIESKVARFSPDCVILQTGASSVERPVGASPSEIEYFKQQTIISANNIFTPASRVTNASRKVVLMKLPIRKKDSLLKTTLSRLFNETIINLKNSASHCDQLILLEDRYYKRQVTSDLIGTITQVVHEDAKLRKEEEEWNTAKSGRKVSKPVRSSQSFILPTMNRFEHLGN